LQYLVLDLRVPARDDLKARRLASMSGERRRRARGGDPRSTSALHATGTCDTSARSTEDFEMNDEMKTAHAGTKIKLGGEEHLILREEDILGVIEA
jgi:hypothetical protein